MIERHVIVTWYTPEEKLPDLDVSVIATVSGKADNITFDHALTILFWCGEGEGWYSAEYDFKELEVHYWCDLAPCNY